MRDWWQLARFSYRFDRLMGWPRWRALVRAIWPYGEKKVYPGRTRLTDQQPFVH